VCVCEGEKARGREEEKERGGDEEVGVLRGGKWKGEREIEEKRKRET